MFVMTDSGGIQTETTILNVPCLTLRDTTEWKVTLRHGTNTLMGENSANLQRAVTRLLAGKNRAADRQVPLWDGHASERIVNILASKR